MIFVCPYCKGTMKEYDFNGAIILCPKCDSDVYPLWGKRERWTQTTLENIEAKPVSNSATGANI